MRGRGPWPLALFLLTAATFLWLAQDAADTTPVLIDEFAHIPAGVSYWETGRFHIYRESPPLVRYLISLPAWLGGARLDYSHVGVGHRSEWAVGRDYLLANADRYPVILRGARYVNVALGLLNGSLLFWWATLRCGPVAGLVVSAAWLLDPGIIAFSAAGTTDVGTAFFALLAAYAFSRFLGGRPTWGGVVLAGVALGLAEGSKFSMLVLYPAWFAVLLAMPRALAPASDARPRLPWWRSVAVLVISLFVLNALYLGDGTFRRLGSYTFRSRLLTGIETTDVHAPPAANRFAGTIWGQFPVPLPKDYVLGLDSQKWDEEFKLVRLSGGRPVRGGVWHGPLDTFLLKRPLGTLGLIALAIAMFVARPGRLRAIEAVPVVTGLAVMMMLAAQTGLNWVDRYAFPAFPPLVVACGPAIAAAWNRLPGRLTISACIAWNAIALGVARPDYLSYANELAGGSMGAVHRFLGSNYDWGQDLFRLTEYLDRHPEIRPVTISYYGALGEEVYGIKSHPIPDTFLPERTLPAAAGAKGPAGEGGFYWVISANFLNGLPIDTLRTATGVAKNVVIDSTVLRPERAIARVGYTLYLFHIVPAHGARDVPAALRESDLARCLRYVDRNEGLITP